MMRRPSHLSTKVQEIGAPEDADYGELLPSFILLHRLPRRRCFAFLEELVNVFFRDELLKPTGGVYVY
jgi:hypothetical protein